jgi:hypothetical protein
MIPKGADSDSLYMSTRCHTETQKVAVSNTPSYYYLHRRTDTAIQSYVVSNPAFFKIGKYDNSDDSAEKL